METNNPISASFDEAQPQKVITEMINASRENINSHGILFILWGWINFINFFAEYLSGITDTNYQVLQLERSARIVLPLLGLIFTIIYAFSHRKQASSYITNTLRYVWISVFLCLILTNIIQFNILRQVYFNLQHPIFMLFIAFAIVVSGSILRHKLIITGGITFGTLALISSMVPLESQLLVESIGWLVAFIIPGHITYSKRKNITSVQ